MTRLVVEGCNNFRELGGLPTAGGQRLRRRLLFRADGLHCLTPEGVRTVCEELAIRHVVDLRSSGERRLDGLGPLADQAVKIHHVPLFDGEVAQGERPPTTGATLGDLYFAMLRFAAQPIAQVVRTLAEADAPAVFHCAAGKDRTGVISAVLLGGLGVPDEVVVADYAASREGLEAVIERLMESEGYREMFAALPPDTLHAEPETMIRLIAQVRDAYGGMRGYLAEIGVDEPVLERLSERLLE